MNTRYTYEKDILALRVLKAKGRTGPSKLEHDVISVGFSVAKTPRRVHIRVKLR